MSRLAATWLHCLSELADVEHHAVHPDEVKWALVFHDAIYDPRRRDNEARSADWACSVMAELGRPEAAQQRVRAMILATAHAAEPRTPDADEAKFDEYDRAVRRFWNRPPGASACFIPRLSASVTRSVRARISGARSSASRPSAAGTAGAREWRWRRSRRRS